MSDGTIDDIIKTQLDQYHLFREQLAQSRARGGGRRRAPVITISRMTGCCARDLSLLLSSRLGLQVWAPELIDLVANDAQLSREVAEILEADTLERIATEMRMMIESQQCRDDAPTLALVRVVKILAETGGVVIHGRGGAFILGDQADLRIRLVAPEAHRVQIVMQRRGLGEREAGVFMRAGDSQRAAFIRLHFHADVDDARRYDLVLNTERVKSETALELAVRYLSVRGFLSD
ncbi:MAG TPA: cytidylate kinase-like family protein [Candidatus Krumholzibacteria bacterium]|nr:cytidylate kinase-like family protein [Candidatus Krumholzibacteria bacterium]HPD72909.1 cytidylate kinase-like family protein [Candidatus Krumholzibacteria bacterium]HRY41708.1 cytidylate kinase-like family protein [Candidatus Krumholzibacteria bacterium]